MGAERSSTEGRDEGEKRSWVASDKISNKIALEGGGVGVFEEEGGEMFCMDIYSRGGWPFGR